MMIDDGIEKKVEDFSKFKTLRERERKRGEKWWKKIGNGERERESGCNGVKCEKVQRQLKRVEKKLLLLQRERERDYFEKWDL